MAILKVLMELDAYYKCLLDVKKKVMKLILL